MQTAFARSLDLTVANLITVASLAVAIAELAIPQ